MINYNNLISFADITSAMEAYRATRRQAEDAGDWELAYSCDLEVSTLQRMLKTVWWGVKK